MVRDALGRPGAQATLMVANGNECKLLRCDASGAAPLEGLEFQWSHVLALAPNHSPLLVQRRSLSEVGDMEIAFPPPVFFGAVTVLGTAEDVPDLRIDRPWIETSSWPDALRRSYEVPDDAPLEIEHPNGLVFYSAPARGSVTIASHGRLRIVSDGAYMETKVFPAGERDALIQLAVAPRLVVSVTSDYAEDAVQPVRAYFVARDEGDNVLAEHVANSAIGASVEFPLPPKCHHVAVTIRHAYTDAVYAVASVPTRMEDVYVTLAVDLLGKRLRLVDSRGQPVAGAVAVQAGGRLGVSGADGTIRVRPRAGSDGIAFLAKALDITSYAIEDLMSLDVVVLRDATGASLALTGVPADVDLESLSVTLEGAALHSVVFSAAAIVAEVYGLRMHNAEMSASGCFASFLLPATPPGVPIAIAGIFSQPQERAPGRLLLHDAFGETAGESGFAWSLGQRAAVNIDLSGAFQLFRGEVLDALSGAPVPAAEVSVGSTGKFVLTDDRGRFEVLAASSNSGYVVSAPGYVTRLAQSSEPRIGLLPARDLELQVTDAVGTRIDVEIELQQGASSWGATRRSVGVYSFEGIPAGLLSAKITWKGIVHTLPVEPGHTTVTLALK